MNLQSPELLTNWTDAELISQSDAWQAITDTTENITDLAASGQWRALKSLADSRQEMIEIFFEQPICSVLFQQILIDLDVIKSQHKTAMNRVRDELNRNHERNQQLITTQAEIRSTLSTQMPRQ